MSDSRDLPDSVFDNVTPKEKTAFAQTLEKLAPSLKIKIIETIQAEAATSRLRYDKITTLHEKDAFF
jgi:hypothetical protein